MKDMTVETCIEDAAAQAILFEAAGADAIHISHGLPSILITQKVDLTSRT